MTDKFQFTCIKSQMTQCTLTLNLTQKKLTFKYSKSHQFAKEQKPAQQPQFVQTFKNE